MRPWVLATLLWAAPVAQGQESWTAPARKKDLYENRVAGRSSDELRAILGDYVRLHDSDGFDRWVIRVSALELSKRLRGDPSARAERLDLLRLAERQAQQEHDVSAQAGIVVEIAKFLREDGQDAQAEAELEACLSELRGDSKARPMLLWFLADIAQYRLDWDRAELLLEQAQSSLQPIRLHDEWRYAILGLAGQVYLGMGLPDRAALPIEQAVRGAESLHAEGRVNWGLRMSVHNHRANLRLATERHAKLIAEVEPFLDEPIPDTHAAARASLVLRLGRAHQERAYAHPEHTSAARAWLEEAVDHRSVRAIDRRTAELRLAQLDLWTGATDSARSRLAAAEGRSQASAYSPLDRAFLAGLRARLALMEAASGELEERLRTLERAFDELLESWRSNPVRRGGIGYLRYGRTRVVLSELTRLRIALFGPEQGALRALEDVFRAQAIGTLSRTLGGDETDFADVPDLIPPGGGLLVLLPGKDQVHAFAWDSEGLVCGESTTSVEAKSLRRELALVMRRPPADSDACVAEQQAFLELGARLAELTLSPAVRARLASWSSVTVVGSDLVGTHGIDALVVDGRPLVLGWAVSVLPSLPVGLALVRNGATAPEPALCLVSGVRYGPGARERFPELADLPIDPAFAPALVEAYAGSGAILSGDQATLENLKRELASRPSVLQFLTHGVRDVARERYAGMALADSEALPNGFLGPDQVEDIDVGMPHLVVAAACGSGMGPFRDGDAAAGHLGGSFLRRGARAVVLSTTDLALEPACLALEELHERLVAGEVPAEALQGARVRLAATERFEHPFYYAALQVLGAGHRPAFAALPRADSPFAPRLVIAFALLLFGGGLAAALALRRRTRRRRSEVTS